MSDRRPPWPLAVDLFDTPDTLAALTAKNQVTLEIAGARYKMTSDADEGHLERLAELINARIQALGAKAVRAAAPAQILAVVALGLADDLLTSEERRQQLEAATRQAITKAITRIDEHLERERGDALDGESS